MIAGQRRLDGATPNFVSITILPHDWQAKTTAHNRHYVRFDTTWLRRT